ncbi:MAG: hypothetical protein QXS41_03925 [Candidatus Woesearchaeota archaeon]
MKQLKKKIVFLLVLLFLTTFYLFNIFAVSEIIFIDPKEGKYSLSYENQTMIYVPEPISGKYTLVIYNIFEEEVFSLEFNDKLLLIIPYDINRFKKARIYEFAYLLMDFDLDLCNYNAVCEAWEYDCKDCKVEQITTKSQYVVPKKRNPLLINLFLSILLLILSLIILVLFYKKYFKRKNDQNIQPPQEQQNYSYPQQNTSISSNYYPNQIIDQIPPSATQKDINQFNNFK